MSAVGKRHVRVDAYEKATGRAAYTDDLAPANALVAKVVHSTIAHGRVLSIDTSEAEKIEGVVKIVTCFDVPKIEFPTAGHPWSLEPAYQDVADRLLLNEHVRMYGDDIAAVIAENELAARHAVRAIKVEYETYPFVLDQIEAMQPGAPQLHEQYPNNILGHDAGGYGDYDEAIKEEGLICVDGWYDTPVVQHCHIENHNCFAYMEKGKIIVHSSTQIPHIVRRVVGQALGCPWGNVRIIKPYVGGGFGNKQDALYEPLCAFLTTQVGGRCVKIDMTREETFYDTRVRHSIRYHIISHVRKDGTLVARRMETYAKQGAYASHGHGVNLKGCGAMAQLYPCKAVQWEAWTVYTNTPSAGAMRGYGMPQVTFALECHVDDVARKIGMDPVALRQKTVMPVGFTDAFSHTVNFFPSHLQCMEKGMQYIHWDEKRKEYANQTGPVRRGVGMSIFWYNSGAYPIKLEVSSCRMVLNQDGSMQMQLGETELGQGADTAFSQMGADAVGMRFEDVHIITKQDTDVTPFGLGAYASRQTYVAGKAIWDCGRQFREKILNYATYLVKRDVQNMDIVESNIIYVPTGEVLISLADLAVAAFYDLQHATHLTAECTHQCRSNAYTFGCCFAEVEVDIPMCKVKLLNIINVHDCGRLINPATAEAQVHGGTSMAIGYGLNEQLLFDERTGRPMNGTLLDYKISTIMDHPHLEAQFVENPDPTHPFGAKGLGEPPALPGAPAIRNAIAHATGMAVNDAPVNSHRLYEAFRQAGVFEELKEYV